MVTPGAGRFGDTSSATPFTQTESEPAADEREKGPAAARRLGPELEELREYAAYYLAAKADSIKVSIRQALTWAALGIGGLIVLGALIWTATAALMVGASLGVAYLFDPDLAWLGPLITGFGVLVILAVTTVIGLRVLTGTTNKRIREKYARRRQEQLARFGHDVGDLARRAR